MAMTIDEAIKRYKNNAEYERTHGNLQGCLEFRQLAEWLKDYKRLLEQEPTKIDCKHTDCNNCVNHKYCDYESTTKNDLWIDCISREATKQAIREKFSSLADRCEINEVLNSMPSVYSKSDKPSGKWIYDGHHLRCSNCNDYHAIKDSDWNLIASNYCPNCGSKNVVEPQESEKV